MRSSSRYKRLSLNCPYKRLTSIPKSSEWLDIHRLRELNNGRLAMVAITAMVAQELNTGLNLILSDEVLEMKGSGALKAMEAACAGSADENACAKAFEAAVAAGTQVL